MSFRALFVALPLLTLTSSARADIPCFPACRSGYLCSAQGTCVSRCNPPCGQGEKCLANGECELSSSLSSLPSSSPASPASSASTDEEPTTKLSLHGGALFQSSNSRSAGGFLTAFQVLIGTQHAAVLGARFGVLFYEGHTTPEVGLDVGYRARFGSGDLRGGPMILAQPQLWFGNGATAIHLGGAVGGFIEYKQLIVSIPVGGGAVRSTAYNGQWNGVFTVAPTLGVRF
ncbi:hypothetical protein LZC95_52810 [Pendulispora brunnea]|uniref:Uncharacterized protein n=1 Tax=Pendulispora brunnea TaxID=2905690 RepID=A0ABZ2KCB9_9BACT